jgi:hypothetical protein
MDLKLYHCDECKIRFEIKDLFCSSREFLKYTLALVAINETGEPMNCTMIDPTNNTIVTPSGFIAPNGEQVFFFEIIPLNGFVSGPIEFFINGVDSHGNLCTKRVIIEFPECKFGDNNGGHIAKQISEIKANNNFTLYPNPTNSNVTVQYDCQYDNITLEVFDITGKLLLFEKLQNKLGEVTLDTTALSAGLYLVVLKELLF